MGQPDGHDPDEVIAYGLKIANNTIKKMLPVKEHLMKSTVPPSKTPEDVLIISYIWLAIAIRHAVESSNDPTDVENLITPVEGVHCWRHVKELTESYRTAQSQYLDWLPNKPEGYDVDEQTNMVVAHHMKFWTHMAKFNNELRQTEEDPVSVDNWFVHSIGPLQSKMTETIHSILNGHVSPNSILPMLANNVAIYINIYDAFTVAKLTSDIPALCLPYKLVHKSKDEPKSL